MELTECGSLGAFDDEGVVALFHLGGLGDVEHEAVRAYLLGHGASVAVIVLVALLVVGIETIIWWALELGGGRACGTADSVLAKCKTEGQWR